MVKLYKYFKKTEEEKTAVVDTSSSKIFEENPDDEIGGRPSIVKPNIQDDSSNNHTSEVVESRVGAAMSDLTTKRVIVLVLVMLIVIPLLSYSPIDLSESYGTDFVHEFAATAKSNGADVHTDVSEVMQL